MALAAASPAGAGSLRVDPEGIRGDYMVTANEVNDVTLTFDGTQYIFTDTAGVQLVTDFYIDDGGPPPPPPSGPCSQIDATTASCPASVGSWGLDLAVRSGDPSPNSFRYNGLPPPFVDPNYGEFLTVYGGQGSDTFSGTPAIDLLSPRSYFGADGNAPNTVHGDAGDDLIYGDSGPDESHGGPGNDLIDGGDGPDAIFADDGNDRIRGGPGSGPDGVETNGDDVVRGGAGDDTMNGWYGNDRQYGEAGNDVVEGGPGDDLSDGGPGRDGLATSFHGSGCPGGRDTFVGGSGRDSVYHYCGAPIFRLKDGERDKVECALKTKPVSAKRDRVDRFSGKPCRKFNPKKRKRRK